MFSDIARFEIKYQALSPVFIAVFTIFFLLVFAGVTIDQVQVGGGGATNINSPNALTINVAIFSLFGGLIPAAFLSSGVLRDSSFKIEELFYSRPISKISFVLGRFTGGFIATALCFLSVPLAFLIGSFMPWLDQELIGPTNLGWYVYIYLTVGLVNMWVIGSILFAVAAFTRSQLGVWIGFLGLLVLYLVGSSIAGQEPSLRDELALLDPFGFNTYAEVTRYWTAFEQNSQVVPFEGVMMVNRLLWIAIGAILVAITVATFQFRKAGSGSAKKTAKAQIASGPTSAISDIDLPRVTPSEGSGTASMQFFSRTAFEVKGVVLNVAFWVILAFGLFNTVPGFFLGSGLYGTDNYPVTRVMMNIVAGAYSIIPIIIVIYYASELVWRERRFRFNEIVEATPAPSWVFVVSKALAMIVVIAALAVVAIVAAALSQAIMGYTNFEFDQYVLRGLVEIVAPAALLAFLAIFFQVLLNNRWLGMAAMLVFFIVSLVMSQIGFDHNLYQYGSSPGAPYSDMNGYGHFLGMSLWFIAYWSFWALLLMVVAYQLWNRGALTPILTRLKALPRTYTPATAVLTLVALVGIASTGGFIFYNTNVLTLTYPDRTPEHLQRSMSGHMFTCSMSRSRQSPTHPMRSIFTHPNVAMWRQENTGSKT